MPPKMRWVDKPPEPALSGRRGKYDWPRIVADLQSRPGQWLLIDEKASIGLPTAIKNRKMRALKDPEWTFTVRTTDNNRTTGTCKVFMSAEKRK